MDMFLKEIARKWFGVNDKQTAARLQRKFAIVYGIVGWNCFAVGFYYLMKQRTPTDSLEKKQALTKLTGLNGNLHVYQIKGLHYSKEFDITSKTDAENKEDKEEVKQEKPIMKIDNH